MKYFFYQPPQNFLIYFNEELIKFESYLENLEKNEKLDGITIPEKFKLNVIEKLGFFENPNPSDISLLC